MNTDLLQMAVRKVVTMAAGYFATKGVIENPLDQGAIDTLVGAAMIVFSTVWSYLHQRKLKNATVK